MGKVEFLKFLYYNIAYYDVAVKIHSDSDIRILKAKGLEKCL